MARKIVQKIGLVVLILLVISLLSTVVVEVKNRNNLNNISQKQSNVKYSKTDAQNDIDEYLAKLEEVHPDLYHASDKITVNQVINEVKSSLKDEVTKAELVFGLSKIASEFNDEHIYIDLANHMFKDKKLLPLELEINNTNDIVVKKDYSNVIPNGSKIISLGEKQIGNYINQYIQYKSGTGLSQKRAYVVEDLPKLLSLSGEQNINKVEYILPNGETKVSDLNPIDVEKFEQSENRYERNRSEMIFHFERFSDTANVNLGKLIDDMFKEINDQKITALTIDISNNRGGASSYGDQIFSYISAKKYNQLPRSTLKVSQVSRAEFEKFIPSSLRWLPIQYALKESRPMYTQDLGTTYDIFFPENTGIQKYSGEVTVKISEKTMSSGSLFVASFKQQNRGKVVGRATGGYPQHYGNVWDYALNKSGIIVSLPSSINYGNGGEYSVLPNAYE